MDEFPESNLQQRDTIAQPINNEPASIREPGGIGEKNVARIAMLAVGAIGIVALPFVTLFLNRALLLPKRPAFIGSHSRTVTNGSAVLAVDTTGLAIQAKNDSAPIRELLEQAAVQHLARLHRTYSRWAEKNGDLMGRILLKLSVDTAGKVVSVEPLVSHVTNSSFAKTVVEDVRKWKFPKSGIHATEITVPLLFVPKGMDPETVVQWERKVRSTEEEEALAAGPPSASKAPTVGERSPTVSPPPPVALQPNPTKPSIALVQRPQKEEVLVAVKTNRSVTIRDNPRFSARKVHDVDEDTPLSIIDTHGDWLKVRTAHAGLIGFVRKEFVSPIN